MERRKGTLHFICGRLASGKTTLARLIAEREPAVLICEDVWLSKLSEGSRSFDDYLKWSRRCREVMGPLIIDMLRIGTSVVLDFGGNTSGERKWVRSLLASAGADHVLHVIDVPEEVCLARLKARNETRPDGLYFASTSEEEFKAITRYFEPPVSDEGFNILRE